MPAPQPEAAYKIIKETIRKAFWLNALLSRQKNEYRRS